MEPDLNQMNSRERKRLGAVYTPPEVVKYILNAVGYTVDKDIENRFLIDPACGSGNFITEAASRLLERLRRIGLDTNNPKGARKALKTLSFHIHGIDIDPKACQMAISALRRRFRRLYETIYEADEKVQVSYNIKCMDALTLINENLEETSLDNTFDYVVGNPPYIRLENISKRKRETYKKLYRSATGRFDISVLFLELGINLLRQDGKLGYITTNRFMLTDYGRKIRELVLGKARIREIIDFNGSGVFEEVTNYPCIIILKKSKERGRFKVASVYKKESLNKISEKLSLQDYYDQRMESFDLKQEDLTGEPWFLVPPQAMKIFEKIRKAGPTLDKVTERIGVGTASGLDKVFVVPERKAKNLERELLKPAVKGEDVRRWNIQWQGLYLIVPYLNKGEKIKTVDISLYPQTKTYLESYRKDLEKRYCVRNGKEWYELHDSVDPSMSEKLKIITPDISDCNNFALDKGKYHCLHTCYFIYPEVDAKYLLGLLNSEVLEFHFKLMSPTHTGGFHRYMTQYLKKLPVAQANSDRSTEIIKAVDRRDEETLNKAVSQLYNISANELETIRKCLARWRP